MSSGSGRFLSFVLILASVMAVSGISTAFAAEGERKAKVKVEPRYPELARRMHISGLVKIEVTIAPNGTIKRSKVIGGNPLLIQAALDVLPKWKFEPGPNEDVQTIEFRFVPQ